ncbi:hypothetical protein GCK72_020607 [Caenorhabditis remanei]|uniref:Uncharacterized protein n=1 Tax=Caenorhabditis remanei TaxID=31234 RepID=A0A6A5GHY4_CAERE|nr:hypothetical protein GCK72_020607 [Caenorhabditis remanei]KAF1754049.1 hypothetical protein GCK72_020607 [Caenorhabditis remanei]
MYSNFELIDMKTGNALLEGQDLQFRQIVHTRALLILHWQQREETSQLLPPSLKLNLTVNWMNCSSWDAFLHRLPRKNFTIDKENRSITLLDFDCVPDLFRNWCGDSPGRDLHFLYVLEKTWHTVEMRIVCDPEISRMDVEGSNSWFYGVIAAFVILTGILYKKKKQKGRQYRKLREDIGHENFDHVIQDTRFLTVPVRYRIRREDSGRRMMEARKDYVPFKPIKITKKPMKSEKWKIDRKLIPKIIVYAPD